eukprot:272589-Rhodomonas_salina.1
MFRLLIVLVPQGSNTAYPGTRCTRCYYTGYRYRVPLSDAPLEELQRILQNFCAGVQLEIRLPGYPGRFLAPRV